MESGGTVQMGRIDEDKTRRCVPTRDTVRTTCTCTGVRGDVYHLNYRVLNSELGKLTVSRILPSPLGCKDRGTRTCRSFRGSAGAYALELEPCS